MKIFLIGFMGSGKTTLGKKLARRMGFNFIDLDEYIQSKESKPIHEIFAKSGEEVFRQMEAENLRLLEKIEGSIISVGGGAPCFYNNMEWMNEQGFTVYLKQSPDYLYQRLKSSKTKRPLLSGLKKKDLFNYISESLQKRSEFYEQAHLIIDTGNLKTKQLEEMIRDALGDKSD